VTAALRITDGFVDLGSSVQSVAVGYLSGIDWILWPIFLMPFAFIGALVAWRIWHELPAATRHYIENVERKPQAVVGTPQPVAVLQR